MTITATATTYPIRIPEATAELRNSLLQTRLRGSWVDEYGLKWVELGCEVPKLYHYRPAREGIVTSEIVEDGDSQCDSFIVRLVEDQALRTSPQTYNFVRGPWTNEFERIFRAYGLELIPHPKKKIGQALTDVIVNERPYSCGGG